MRTLVCMSARHGAAKGVVVVARAAEKKAKPDARRACPGKAAATWAGGRRRGSST